MTTITNNSITNVNTGDLHDHSVLNQTIYHISCSDDENILETPQKFGIPINIPKIIGRDKKVEELYEKVIVQKKRVVITGVGGVGKTFLSLHCAKKWSPPVINHSVKHIVFFNCETEDVFKISVNNTAKLLKINISDETNLLETFKQIYLKFDKNDSLFIYDNVDSYDIIRNYLPPVEIQNFHVIVTSQISKWGNLLKCYSLGMMESDEATELIMDKLNSDHKTEVTQLSITDLILTFDGYPLGLTHATSFINNELEDDFNRFDINEIIENYIRKIRDYIKENPPVSSDDMYRTSVTAAILINFNKISEDVYFEKNPRVKIVIDRITKFLAFGNPEQINSDEFEVMTKLSVEKKEIEQSLSIFTKYSIIDIQKYVRSYRNEEYILLNIHRIVQSVLKNTFRNKEVIGIICGLIQCFEFDGYRNNKYVWCSHVDKNVIFECTDDEWEGNCYSMVTTPSVDELVESVINVLTEEIKTEKSGKYLEIFCETLMLHGNVYVYKNCIERNNNFFTETFRRILDVNDSSLTVWDHEVQILESKLPLLGIFLGHFNFTYNHWANVHWYAWWNWIDKLKEFEIEQLLSPGWKNWTVIHVGALTGRTEILKIIPGDKLKAFNDVGVGEPSNRSRKVNALKIASYFKHIEYMEVLLDNGWNPSISNNHGVINYVNDVEVTELLVNRGANINKLNLKKAIDDGEIRVIKLLIENNADLKLLNKFEQTICYVLVRTGLIDKNQIPAEIQVDDKEFEKEFILHWAAKNGLIQIAQMLLKSGFDVNQTNNHGEAALHLAVVESKLDMARLLLESGAKVNLQTTDGDTPLHFAAGQTDTEIVELLLEYKADVNMLNNVEYNALTIAVKFYNITIVQLLLEKGIDLNGVDCEGYNVLQHAVLKRNVDMVKLLLDHGADVNVCNGYTESPLRFAVTVDSVDLVKLLLDYNAAVNLRSKEGDTALHWTSACCTLEITRLLFEFGADPNMANENGKTILHCVLDNNIDFLPKKLNLLKFIQLLLDNGADPDAIDNDGNKPIDWANHFKYIEVSRLLLRYTTNQRRSYFDKDLFNKNEIVQNNNSYPPIRTTVTKILTSNEMINIFSKIVIPSFMILIAFIIYYR